MQEGEGVRRPARAARGSARALLRHEVPPANKFQLLVLVNPVLSFGLPSQNSCNSCMPPFACRGACLLPLSFHAALSRTEEPACAALPRPFLSVPGQPHLSQRWGRRARVSLGGGAALRLAWKCPRRTGPGVSLRPHNLRPGPLSLSLVPAHPCVQELEATVSGAAAQRRVGRLAATCGSLVPRSFSIVLDA